MRHRSILSSCCMLLAIAMLAVSCSKEGPAGAQGPAGPAGPTGAAGASGTKGDPGTANVIYSDWLDVTYQFVVPDSVYIANITAAKLDATILNTGEVKIYLNLSSAATPQIVPLPYVDIFSGLYIQPFFSLNKIQLESDANVSTRTTNNVKSLQCRYILIPGGTHTRSAIDWNDYKQVQAYLGLKD